jgi:L1 cell adhesion molecule like protein
MQVIWKRLYSQVSAAEKGTLYQLRNLIHRTSVPINPKKGMNESEDFMETLLRGHVLASACQISGVDLLSKDVASHITTESLAQKILDSFISPYFFPEEPAMSNDKVHSYVCDFLCLALIWFSFQDAVREGDGPQVITLWKVFMIAFR